MTVCLFVGFMNISIPGKRFGKAIVSVAPLTLGVYLIHAHANVSPWSWEILDLPGKMNFPAFPLVQLGCVIAIFAICAAIDFLRKVTVGKIENSKIIVAVCNTAPQKLNALFTKCFKE
jgi:hypothetical protein